MRQTVVIIADLGNFRAYRWDGDQSNSTPSLELVDDFVTLDARTKRANTLTVMEGRSANGGSNSQATGTASDGEQHNMQLEKTRRLIRQIAHRATDLLRLKDVERGFFAAPQEINHQILENIAPDARAKIELNLPIDLTRLPKSEVVGHFFGQTAGRP